MDVYYTQSFTRLRTELDRQHPSLTPDIIRIIFYYSLSDPLDYMCATGDTLILNHFQTLKTTKLRCALKTSITYGHLNVIKILVEQYGANLVDFETGANGLLPCATRKGQFDVIQYIVQNQVDHVVLNADYNDYFRSAVKEAVKTGDLNVVKYLINQYPVIDPCSFFWLRKAVKHGHMDVTKYLIDEVGCCIDEIVLRGAIRGGHIDMVKYLVEEQGADIHNDHYGSGDAFQYALDVGQKEVAKYLIECSASVCDLAWAAFNGQWDVFKQNINKSYRGEKQWAWRLAAQQGHLDIFKYLTEEYVYSDNLSVYMMEHNHPLVYAAEFGHLHIIKYLYPLCKEFEEERGGRIYPFVPFYLLCTASKYGYLDIVKYLREECNASVRPIDSNDDDPLLLAVYRGHLDIVKYLVEQGVDPCGYMRLAIEQSHWSIVNYFETLKHAEAKKDKEKSVVEEEEDAKEE